MCPCSAADAHLFDVHLPDFPSAVPLNTTITTTNALITDTTHLHYGLGIF